MYYLTTLFAVFLCLFFKSDPVELIPVDAGVEDLNVLSKSLRVEQRDIRQNQSFEQLYRVKGSPEIFVRRAGSLHAVFRDSHYGETSNGTYPIVPTGTIYCIGEVTEDVLAQLGVLLRGQDEKQQQQQDVDMLASVSWQPTPPAASHPTTKTIRFLDDESYRRRRLASFVLEVVLE